MIKNTEKFLDKYSELRRLNTKLNGTIEHIKNILGDAVFLYDGLEYYIPKDLFFVYDIDCPCEDSVLYVEYLDTNLDSHMIIMHKHFLAMTDEELKKLKGNNL